MYFVHISNGVCSMSEKHTILERVKIRDVFPFSWRVFATWDFSVTSKSGVITKYNVLRREFKVCAVACNTCCLSNLLHIIYFFFGVYMSGCLEFPNVFGWHNDLFV